MARFPVFALLNKRRRSLLPSQRIRVPRTVDEKNIKDECTRWVPVIYYFIEVRPSDVAMGQQPGYA